MKQLAEAEANFEEAKAEVPDNIFNRYYRLTTGIKLPVVVPLRVANLPGLSLACFQ